MKLFHLTSQERAQRILRTGLDPKCRSNPRHPQWAPLIYLSNSAEHALGYAAQHDGPTVLLEVDSRSLAQSALGPDDVDLPDVLAQEDSPDNWSSLTWRQSLRRCGQCTYGQLIPPSLLRVARGRAVIS